MTEAVDTAVIVERVTQLEKRMDERFTASEGAVSAAFAAAEKAVKKAEDRLDNTLIGFPQEYARRLEIDILRSDLADLKNAIGLLINRGELEAVIRNVSALIDRNREDIDVLAKKLS
jgi:Tfp pilus assembly protein PilX